jgi:uncharacterized protein (TIGR02444 family)
MTNTESKNQITPFWRFSLNYYKQAGVSEACIALQDDCGVDVNLLLFLFWLASERQMLSADEVGKLDASIQSWRELTIIPIRDTRRKLKGAKTFVDPAKQEALRDKVKAVELGAEQLQQEALYAFTQRGPLGKPAEPPAAARGNVAAYAQAIGNSFPQQTIDTLIRAFDSIEHSSLAAR